MGTSSSRNGISKDNANKDSDRSVSWKSAKSYATKYYKGNGNFGTAIGKVVAAAGGVSGFSRFGREKKSHSFITLLKFFGTAKQIGLYTALAKLGYSASNKEEANKAIVDYINNDIYPESTTYSDSSNREQLINVALSFCSQLFDDTGMVLAERTIFESYQKQIILKDIADEIEVDFEQFVPMSIENDDVEKTLEIRENQKKLLMNKISSYANVFSYDPDDPNSIDEYKHKIYKTVLTDYLEEL